MSYEDIGDSPLICATDFNPISSLADIIESNTNLRSKKDYPQREHRESYKDTEAAMVRPHKKDGSEKVVKKVTEKKNKRKTEKPMGRGHRKTMNPR